MKKALLFVKDYPFITALATTTSEQAKGLMYEKNPYIMSFVYNYPQYSNFWMKNTPSPLEIIFTFKNKITKIAYGKPFSTDMISGGLSDLVIEFPAGYVEKYDFQTGDIVNFSTSPKKLAAMLEEKYSFIK